MPSGVTDLTTIQTLDPKPVVRAAKSVDEKNSFDRVLDRQRKSADKPKPEKPHDDTPAKPADAKKPDIAAKKSNGAKKGDGKKIAKKTSPLADDVNQKVADDSDDADAVEAAEGTAAIEQPAAEDVDPNDRDAEKSADPKSGKPHAADERLTDAAIATGPAIAAQASAVVKSDADPTAAVAYNGEDVAVDAVAAGASQASVEKPFATANDTANTDPATTNATETKAAAHSVKRTADVDQKPAASLDAEKDARPDPKNQKVTDIAQATDDAGHLANVIPDDANTAAKPSVVKSAEAPTVDLAATAPAIPHTKVAVQPAVAPVITASAVPERAVAASNVDRIVTSVRGNLGSNGGTMQIRLDPPTLGTVNVQVSFENGVMTASMQTENEQATRMLSHSLGDLKASLESAGVSVDKIQVKQAAPSEQASSGNQHGGEKQSHDNASYNDSSRQEQQRREMLQRMWRKLSIGTDDLDLVA